MSWGIFHQGLTPFFGGARLLNPIASRLSPSLDGVLAWGNKPSSLKAASLAFKRGIPLFRVEDGFLYGLEPGRSSRASLVVDDLGIYYDASRPSRLEEFIKCDLNDAQIARALSIQALWQQHGVSKYNHAPDWVRPSDEWSSLPFILLIDQTHGDQSIDGALANSSSFQVMLDAALAQTTIPNVLIKVHPEVVIGKKLGHFDISISSVLRANPRIRILDQDCNVSSVIQEAAAIYTVSSQAGFEGLLWNKPVHTFGMPFYAGWGLTYDFYAKPSRRTSALLSQLTYATLVSYPRYVHPETDTRCEIEDIIDFYGLQRKERHRLKKSLIPIVLSSNKRRHLKRFAQGCSVTNINNISPSQQEQAYLIWGSNSMPRPLASDNIRFDQKIIRVEDGFIRSIGLGAALSTPYSWVFDQTGIYYDASRPSDLELLLQSHNFDADLLRRAEVLRNKIIHAGVSKYNLKDSNQSIASLETLRQARSQNNAQFLLVIGQVESDASIKLGGVDIQKNAELLKAVRLANPGAYIIYKPHPDIEHALRFSGANALLDPAAFDLMLTETSLANCLEFINEVHTISSLAGFEALIRGKKVVCYGLPFYAGWGLTTDRHRCMRRTRKLSFLELLAGSLILYPTYLHPRSGLYCTPEALVDEIAIQMNIKKGFLGGLYSLAQKIIMGIHHKIQGI